MSFKLINVEQKNLTKTLARKLVDTESATDRKLNPRRLKTLKLALERGTVGTFHWAVAVCDGVEFRVNGQHSSYLFASDGHPIPQGAQVNLEYYKCDTFDDVEDLWSTFDATFSSRSFHDLAHVHKQGSGHLSSMNSRSLSLSAAALTKRFHGEGSILDGPGKIKLAEEHHEFSMWIGTLTMASPKTKMMRRVGVAYAMLCTYQESKAKAKEFWKEVIEGTGANPQSGSRRLQIKLMQTLRGAGSGVSNQMDWFVIAGFCLSAWNSWKKGEDKLGNFRLTDIYRGKWAPHKTGKSKK